MIFFFLQYDSLSIFPVNNWQSTAIGGYDKLYYKYNVRYESFILSFFRTKKKQRKFQYQ